VAKVKRDCKAEYVRRIARCAPRGIARSQAGRPPKPRKAALSAKRPTRWERSLQAATEAARG
jgi:hypothetical protein